MKFACVLVLISMSVTSHCKPNSMWGYLYNYNTNYKYTNPSTYLYPQQSSSYSASYSPQLSLDSWLTNSHNGVSLYDLKKECLQQNGKGIIHYRRKRYICISGNCPEGTTYIGDICIPDNLLDW